MSSFAKQTRFPALAFRRPVIISGTIEAEAFSQENSSFFLLNQKLVHSFGL